nr:MAG TPA: hypothetical protein [Caudoviricetes sp.]
MGIRWVIPTFLLLQVELGIFWVIPSLHYCK